MEHDSIFHHFFKNFSYLGKALSVNNNRHLPLEKFRCEIVPEGVVDFVVDGDDRWGRAQSIFNLDTGILQVNLQLVFGARDGDDILGFHAASSEAEGDFTETAGGLGGNVRDVAAVLQETDADAA